MNPNNSKVLKELNAYIEQAWKSTEGSSIRHDPALARDLEWIRDCYEFLYKEIEIDFDEDNIQYIA